MSILILLSVVFLVLSLFEEPGEHDMILTAILFAIFALIATVVKYGGQC